MTIGKKRVLQDSDGDLNTSLSTALDVSVPAPFEMSLQSSGDETATMEEEHDLGGFARVADPENSAACLFQFLDLAREAQFALGVQPCIIRLQCGRGSSLNFAMGESAEDDVDDCAEDVVWDGVAIVQSVKGDAGDVVDHAQRDWTRLVNVTNSSDDFYQL